MNASTATTWARVLGFHTPVLAFALRTALAAFAALLLAYALGLEHPHWAAMSAWACSQPMREHLLSRGIYRFAGSVVGVAFAVGLVLLAQESIWVLALGLAAWSALCAFLGNLQRGYMAYGCMLAGYSAAMVILLHVGPVAAIWPFAWDRLLTVVTGVLTAVCISWCFAPRRRTAVLIAQSRKALAGVLQAAIAPLRPHAAPARRACAGPDGRVAQSSGRGGGVVGAVPRRIAHGPPHLQGHALAAAPRPGSGLPPGAAAARRGGGGPCP